MTATDFTINNNNIYLKSIIQKAQLNHNVMLSNQYEMKNCCV